LEFQPQLLELPLQVILVAPHPALPLESGGHAGADVVEGKDALHAAALSQVVLEACLLVLLV